ncbi:MAG TPA: MlaD family protein [Polyangiaceae bacterium]|nr:MlaD family protein [Polyangiaceae bacterium]
MRTPVSRLEKVTGAFLTVVGGFFAIAVLVSARHSSLADLFRKGFVVTAVAEDGYGAAIGSPVKVRDVEVGAVTEVTLVDDARFPGKPVRIRMQIQAPAARFLSDKTVARIVRPPFGSGMPPFGTSSIDLLTAGASPLANASTISAEGEDSMVSTFAKLRGDVQAIREQFVGTLKDLAGTLANMRVLTDKMVQGKGMIGRALSDEETAETLTKMVRTASEATVDLRRIAEDMKKASARAPDLEQRVEQSAVELGQVFWRVNQALDSVPRVVGAAERTLATTEELVRELRVASSYAPELARKADVSLDETNRLVEAAQKNFLLRSTMPDRIAPHTEAEVRPPSTFGARRADFPADAGTP